MIVVKVHNAGNGRSVIALCDADLLGKKLEDNDVQLDLSSEFYKGEEKSEAELATLLASSYVAHFVGNEAVAAGRKAGLIAKDNIILIAGIPHAQSMR